MSYHLTTPQHEQDLKALLEHGAWQARAQALACPAVAHRDRVGRHAEERCRRLCAQLLYAAEVRSITDVDIPKTEVKPAELKLAQQLIEQQASDKFDPAAYTDEVRSRIEAAIQKKVEGQEITMAEEPQQGAQVIDLMEALKASLEKKPAKRVEPAKPAAKKAAKK